MATANSRAATAGAQPPVRRRGRRIRWIVLTLVILVVTLFAAFRAPLAGYAGVGTAYAARVGCSCRFVGGRSLEDCAKDFEPGMEMVSLSEDGAARSVTASFPLIRSDTATFHEGWGCVLEPWH
ncbi:hypothetical protein ACFO0A_02965 [Novosphingobium tardum]|jgi:hypothetical protein|uniref:Uncharacterized protein n=1 Tax=Novosphingobium tardum TaxID=1538021 RepID=A0ABV8RKS2_9SPHN